MILYDEFQKNLIAYYTVRSMGRYDFQGDFPYSMNFVSSKHKYGIEVNSISEAAKVAKTWSFPEELKDEISSNRRSFYDLFQSMPQKTVLYDQTRGRLDQRKIPSMMRGIVSGDYIHEKVRPMKIIKNSPIKPPTIAIHMSSGETGIKRNPEHMIKICVMALGMAEAAMAAGVKVWMVSSELYNKRIDSDYKSLSLANIFITPFSQPIYNDFWVVFCPTAWILGHIYMACAYHKQHARLAKAMNMANSHKTANWFTSSFGSKHVTLWLKRQGCDIVIEVGSFDGDTGITKPGTQDAETIKKNIIKNFGKYLEDYYKE